MKHLDLFSGYGGFSIASGDCGITTIGFSEIDKSAISVLKYQFKDVFNYGDIALINPDTLPDFDFMTFGAPCQGYSVAGNRKGMDDPRSQLIFNVFDILKIKQPKYFIFENVAGLLSIEKGEVFKDILKNFCDCGYAVDFDVLNAKDFGVPQNRQRVFVVGVRLDLLDEEEIF